MLDPTMFQGRVSASSPNPTAQPPAAERGDAAGHYLRSIIAERERANRIVTTLCLWLCALIVAGALLQFAR